MFFSSFHVFDCLQKSSLPYSATEWIKEHDMRSLVHFDSIKSWVSERIRDSRREEVLSLILKSKESSKDI